MPLLLLILVFVLLQGFSLLSLLSPFSFLLLLIFLFLYLNRENTTLCADNNPLDPCCNPRLEWSECCSSEVRTNIFFFCHCFIIHSVFFFLFFFNVGSRCCFNAMVAPFCR